MYLYKCRIGEDGMLIGGLPNVVMYSMWYRMTFRPIGNEGGCFICLWTEDCFVCDIWREKRHGKQYFINILLYLENN